MKIFGLLAVVFSILLISKALGISDSGALLGVIVGACSYVLNESGK